MTNVTVVRPAGQYILSAAEKESMFTKAGLIRSEFHRLRARAILALEESGKRRAEIANIEMANVKLIGNSVYVTFIVGKKRKKNVVLLYRTKKFAANSKLGKSILEFHDFRVKKNPSARYLFPRVHSVFGQHFSIDESNPMHPKAVWRIVKELNPQAWPHLYRETRAAEVVKHDESVRGEASLETVYRVKRALDLERETTAWNYISRFATEKIEREEEEEEL